MYRGLLLTIGKLAQVILFIMYFDVFYNGVYLQKPPQLVTSVKDFATVHGICIGVMSFVDALYKFNYT